MENIISGSRTNKNDLEREKYAKDNLNNYVHSGSSFMEFTKQRKNLGIDKTETIDSKNGIDYLQKKHNIFKNPENLLNQAERNKNQEEGLADIYTKNYMKEFNTKVENDLNSSVGVLEEIYESKKRTNGWNDYGKTLENSVKLASDGENITITTIDGISVKKEEKEPESILPKGVVISGGYIKHSAKKEEFVEHEEKVTYDVNSYVQNTQIHKKEQDEDVNSKMYREYLYKNSYKSYHRENEIENLKFDKEREENVQEEQTNIRENEEEKKTKIIEQAKEEIKPVESSENNSIYNNMYTSNSNAEKKEATTQSNYRDTSYDKEEKKEEKKPKFVHKASWYSVEEDDEEELD